MRETSPNGDSIGMVAAALLVIILALAVFTAIFYYLSVSGPSAKGLARGVIERSLSRPPRPDSHRRVDTPAEPRRGEG